MSGVWGVAPRQVAGASAPVFSPGTDAGRVCTKALHDAEPTKHTQPFTTGKGFGDRDRDREFSIFLNLIFLKISAELRVLPISLYILPYFMT